MADYIVNPYDQGINADMAGFAKQATSSTQKSPETIRNETHEFVRQFSTPPAVTSAAELVSEPQESSLLDTGILSIGDREEKAMPEENLGQDDFEEISKEGANKKHVVELMLQMWMAEKEHGALIYENRDSLEWEIFHVTPFPPLLRDAKNKCAEMLEYKMQGTLPSRPYKDKSSNECTKCNFLDNCWAD